MTIKTLLKLPAFIIVFCFILSIPFNRTFAATYYVNSMNGNDAYNGLSPDSAWQSLSKVNTSFYLPNDSILFIKGGVWRGQLLPRSGTNAGYITYANYGTGEKPLLLGSVNKSDTTKWIYEKNNIWYLADTFKADVGNMIFNKATGFGIKKWNLAALTAQGDYWFDKKTFVLRLYSAANPAKYYTDIECAIRKHIIDENSTSYAVYDGLALKYGAAHGIGGANTHHIIARNCDISYIGGGDLDGVNNIRYGNGIEFWDDAHDNLVEQCKIWEIYDTGVTNQNHTYPVQQYNITYRYNLIWNCALGSFEYWNRPKTSYTNNIHFENNTCINAGYGWGVQRPDPKGGHVVFYYNEASVDSIFIRNNIFYNATRTSVFIDSASYNKTNGFNKLIFDHNCYYQPTDTSIMELYPSVFNANNFLSYQTSTGKDANSIITNPLMIDVVNYDLHLSASSPCIDKGTVTNGKNDFEGNPVPQNNVFDIGAYEHLSTSVKNNNNKTETVLTIYPNPAKNFFEYLISSVDDENITVKVIDALGRTVIKKTESISKGVSKKNMEVSSLAKGIYTLQIITDNKEKIEKQFLIQ